MKQTTKEHKLINLREHGWHNFFVEELGTPLRKKTVPR